MSANAGPDIVEDGLVCCLDANDPKSYNGSGSTWFDRSGNTNATILNSPVFEDGYFSLNGTNQYFSVSGVVDFATADAFTVAIWAKSNSSLWSNYGFLISRRNQFVLHPSQSSKNVNFYYYAGGWTAPVTYAPDDITIWHQYMFVYDNGIVDAYLDGELQGSGGNAANNLSSTTNNTNIGFDSGTRYLDGDVGPVHMYNRKLTPDEVKQNYNATKSRFGK